MNILLNSSSFPQFHLLMTKRIRTTFHISHIFHHFNFIQLALSLLHNRTFPSPAVCAPSVAVHSKILVSYCLLYLLYWIERRKPFMFQLSIGNPIFWKLKKKIGYFSFLQFLFFPVTTKILSKSLAPFLN